MPTFTTMAGTLVEQKSSKKLEEGEYFFVTDSHGFRIIVAMPPDCPHVVFLKICDAHGCYKWNGKDHQATLDPPIGVLKSPGLYHWHGRLVGGVWQGTRAA